MATFEHTFPLAVAGDNLAAAVAAVVVLGATRADYVALTDVEALSGQKALAALQRELDTRKAWMAGTLADRSRHELGHSGLAARHGHLSPEALIQDLTGGSKTDAHKLVRVGEMLAETDAADDRAAGAAVGEGFGGGSPEPAAADMPWHAAISRAVAAGELSVDAADAIRRGLGDVDSVVTGTILTTAVAVLLGEASRLNVDQLIKRARRTRDSLDEAGIRKREQKAWDDRYLRLWTDNSGQLHLNGQFPPEHAAFVRATFDSLTGPRRGGVRFVDPEREAWARGVRNDPRTLDQITCDGFVDLLRAGVAVNPNQMLGGRRPVVQVLTTVDPTRAAAGGDTAPAAAEILVGAPGTRGHGYLEGNSAPVSQETIDRIVCDTGAMLLTFDTHGRPLGVGREERLFSPAQRIALAARDGGCRWPACDKPPSFTETHHLEHWARDHGATDINVGILLCRGHHLLLHNHGWQIFENQGRYWLRPPESVDPDQVLIELCREPPGAVP
jgi:hypothetical protein